MDSSFFAGLALVVAGLVGAFFGYRLFRILLPIYGAIAGFLLVWGWLGDSRVFIAVIVGAVVGLALAVVAYGFWSALVYLSGAIVGLALGSVIATSLNLWNWLGLALALVLAAGLGYLFFAIRNPAVIIITGLIGGAATARGVAEWLGLASRSDPNAGTNPTWLTALMIVLFLVVAVAGIRYQWGRYRKLNLYGEKAPAGEGQAAPAATTRNAEVPVSGTGAAAGVPAGGAAVVAAAGAVAVANEKPAGVEAPAEAVAPAIEAPVAAAAVVAPAVAASAAEEEKPVEVEAPVEAVAPVVEAPVAGAAVVAAAVAASAAEEEEPAEVETPAEAVAPAVEAPVAEAAVVAAAVVASAPEEEQPAEVETPVAVDAAEVAAGPEAALVAAAANKVEDSTPGAEAAFEADDAGSANIVEEAIKDIQENYSYEDIAKFKEKLEFVEGIGPVYAEKLVAAGVNTVLDLLKRGATRKGRLELVEATGITGKLILRWVNHADLYRIKGVGSEYADLLEAAGVDTVVELAHRNPANLLNAVVETNKVRNLVRKEPVVSQVEDWVEQAKKLPRVIQY